MAYETILLDVKDRVATITLNRPKRLNAWTGRMAAELGLATRALPAEEVLPAALERARDIAVNTAPVSVAISKRLLWEGVTSSVPEMQKRELPLFSWAGNQADSREGVLAFLEKRTPEWKLSVAHDKPDLLESDD